MSDIVNGGLSLLETNVGAVCLSCLALLALFVFGVWYANRNDGAWPEEDLDVGDVSDHGGGF